jgi:hypothetical protein
MHQPARMLMTSVFQVTDRTPPLLVWRTCSFWGRKTVFTQPGTEADMLATGRRSRFVATRLGRPHVVLVQPNSLSPASNFSVPTTNFDLHLRRMRIQRQSQQREFRSVQNYASGVPIPTGCMLFGPPLSTLDWQKPGLSRQGNRAALLAYIPQGHAHSNYAVALLPIDPQQEAVLACGRGKIVSPVSSLQ